MRILSQFLRQKLPKYRFDSARARADSFWQSVLDANSPFWPAQQRLFADQDVGQDRCAASANVLGHSDVGIMHLVRSGQAL